MDDRLTDDQVADYATRLPPNFAASVLAREVQEWRGLDVTPAEVLVMAGYIRYIQACDPDIDCPSCRGDGRDHTPTQLERDNPGGVAPRRLPPCPDCEATGTVPLDKLIAIGAAVMGTLTDNSLADEWDDDSAHVVHWTLEQLRAVKP